MARIDFDPPPSRSDSGRVHAAPDGAHELLHLVRSAEPAVVFTSLAHLCVPDFADACLVDIVEPGELAYRIMHHPGRTSGSDAAAGARSDGYRAVRTPFRSPPSEREDDRYRGVITYLWRGHRPTLADAARAELMARHGVTTVHEERHHHSRPAAADGPEPDDRTPVPGAAAPRRRPGRPVRCAIRT